MRRVADPALPGLAVALDPDALLELLRARLPECRDELDLEEARIFGVQYRPGERAQILYHLKVRGRNGGRSQRQLLSIHALPSGRASAPPSEETLRRYAALEDRALRTPYLGLEAGLLAYAFPLDPVLDPLLRAFEPQPMRAAFQRLWRSRDVRVRRVRARCLGYTPLARAAIAYEVLSEDRATGAPELRHVIGKIQTDRPASALFAKSWAAWRAARSRVQLAPPVGYVPEINMHLQEHVRGTRLGDLAQSPLFVKWARQAARSLATFHALPIPVADRRDAAKEIRVVARWSNLVAALRPDLASRVGQLRDRLAPGVAASAQMRGPLHGDFHPANVLADGDHVTLIDLDQMARGDPALDVGRFLASLRVTALRVSGDPAALQDPASAFLERYLTQAREQEGRVRLFEAACLLTAAATGFRLQRDSWDRDAEALVAEAERVVDGVTDREVSAPRTPARRSTKEAAEWSRDPFYIRAVLDAPIREAYGAVLRTCRIGSVCRRGGAQRIRYKLTGERAGEPWQIAIEGVVGERRRALKRLRALRQALAGGGDGPLLARPLAYCGPLRLLLAEQPAGTPLGSLLGDPVGPVAAACAGRALAAAQAAMFPGEAGNPLVAELRRAARRVEELAKQRPGLRAELEALWKTTETRLRESPASAASTLWSPTPDNVLWRGGRVAFTQAPRLASGHPLLDPADFLARLRRRGLERRAPGTAIMADRFRDAYCGAGGEASRELAAFEAMALLRAARQAARGRDPQVVEALVELASAALAGRSDAAARSGAGARLDAEGPPMDVDARAGARLRGALARECHGSTGLVGPRDRALARTLSGRGLRVHELGPRSPHADVDASSGEASNLDTILVHDILERLATREARALLGRLRTRLQPEGRLVVCVRHAGDDAPKGELSFDRRRLHRLLRPLGTPRLVTSQPYRWLVMTVEMRERPSPGVRERYHVIASLCRGRVMELGCGPGELSRTLADHGLDVVAVDHNERKIALARQRHPQVRFLAADIRDVEAAVRYDSVVLSEVLEHVEAAVGDAMLAKAWELVAAGGRLVVSVPNEDCVPHPNHVREFDRAELVGLLERFGPPRLVTEQPYRYLLMYVDRAQRR